MVGGAALFALAILGGVYAAYSASFDGAKWRVAEAVALVAHGPRHVDGGFVWNDYHAGKDVWFGPWRSTYESRYCVTLRVQPRAGVDASVLRSSPVWTPTGQEVWIVARQKRAC
jgi:hypothetical protein